MNRILITGVSGLLGNNLALYFRGQFEVMGLFHRHPVHIEGVQTTACDLTGPEAIRSLVEKFAPDAVIHCASLASVDQCEENAAAAHLQNVVTTNHVARAIGDSRAKAIYISTDAVYDGVGGRFMEDAPINPQNHYGRTKYAGEEVVSKLENHLILRTNIFGWNIRNKQSIGEWVLESLIAGQTVTGFSDAIFSSIYTMELARAIHLALQADSKGTFNCGSRDACSKYEFALRLADRFGLDRRRISPIRLDDAHLSAARGKDLSLDVSRIEAYLDYRLPTIDFCLEMFYRDWKSGVPARIKNRAVESPAKLPLSYGRHHIDAGDVSAVVAVLNSDRITQGSKVAEFEQALADYCGVGYAVAVNSGTSALHIACLAAGLGPGDESITSPITFVASANCAAYCGAKPVFADIDPKTYNLSPSSLDKKIGPAARVIVPVHFAGQSCAMYEIDSIRRDAEKKYGRKIFIIEDGSHALGSRYRGKMVGGCDLSDMAVLSFHPVKHITTGEGGAVLTNDREIYERLLLFRTHGITHREEDMTIAGEAFTRRPGSTDEINPWYYEQLELGFNYRITDFQCALGLSQLGKLESFRQKRRNIVERYNRELVNLPFITLPYEAPDCDSNFHLYIIRLDFEGLERNRLDVMHELERHGVSTQVHYIPVHWQPYYRKNYGTGPGDCPRAEGYYRECLTLPLYPAMHDRDVERVIEAVKTAAGAIR